MRLWQRYCNKITVTIREDNAIEVTEIMAEVYLHRDSRKRRQVCSRGSIDQIARSEASLAVVGINTVRLAWCWCIGCKRPSEWLEVEVKQNGKIYKQIFNRGIPQRDLAIVGDSEETVIKINISCR